MEVRDERKDYYSHLPLGGRTGVCLADDLTSAIGKCHSGLKFHS